MTFYSSMVVVLMVFKLFVFLICGAPFAIRGIKVLLMRWKEGRRRAAFQADMSRMQQVAVLSSGDTGGDVMPAYTPSQLPPKVSLSRVLKLSFMFLFMAYPGVSLKLMRLFKCRNIEGVWWLAADMRLQCYTGTWAGYAVYAVIMIALYVVGLPLTLFLVLWRRRHNLFGEKSAKNRLAFGFLYESYGPGAWWWEIEELIRKLLLSAVVVLIDAGSPLQVTLAVLVSGWAHVLHAVFKPWGVGSVKYRLQHGSLFVTSYVFLMGLLFKVDGVSTVSPAYKLLSYSMLLGSSLFMVAWGLCVILALVRTLSKRHPAMQRTLLNFFTVDAVVPWAHPLPDPTSGRVAGSTGDTSMVKHGSDESGTARVVLLQNPMLRPSSSAAAAAAAVGGGPSAALQRAKPRRLSVVDRVKHLRKTTRGDVGGGAGPTSTAVDESSQLPLAGDPPAHPHAVMVSDVVVSAPAARSSAPPPPPLPPPPASEYAGGSPDVGVVRNPLAAAGTMAMVNPLRDSGAGVSVFADTRPVAGIDSKESASGHSVL
jgi:hypothetical protein